MTSKFIWQIGEDWSITKVTKENNKLFANAQATPVYAVIGNSQMLDTDSVEMTCTINGTPYHKMLQHYAKTNNHIIVDNKAVAGWEVVSNGEELQIETSSYDVMTISFEIKRFSSIDGTTLLKSQPTGQTTENVYASDSYTPMIESSDAERLENLINGVNSVKQDKLDTGLNTNDKTVVGAINELESAIGDIDDDIANAISQHNTNPFAHPYLQTRIAKVENVIPTTASETNKLIDRASFNSAMSGKQDKLNDTQIEAINSGISSSKIMHSPETTALNPLVNKDFVNSSIATNTAHFIGTFESVEKLNNVGYLVIYSILKENSVIAKDSVINGTTYNHDTTLDSDLNITADSTLAFGSVIKSGSTIEIGSIINHEEYESQTTTSADIEVETITNNDYANVINRELNFLNTTDMNAYDKDLLTNYDYAWIPNGAKYDLYRFDIASQTWESRATNIDKTDVSLITAYNRYTYNGDTEEWTWNYTVNTSGFTASQWSAINSGITAEKVAEIDNKVDKTQMATKTTAGLVYMWEDADGVHIWNTDPQ